MNLEKNDKQLSSDKKFNSIYYKRQGCERVTGGYPVKLRASQSTPNRTSSHKSFHIIQDSSSESREKNQLIRELYQVKEDIVKFKNELNGLAEQMDGMELDLNLSKNRVQEIEEDITATQEVNVNLQVLLERAVDKQKETDVHATRTMKHIHSNLVNVVQETDQLRGRLTSIANYQRQQQGNVVDVAERIREYGQLLEEAIHSIQAKPSQPPSQQKSIPEKEMPTEKRKKSIVNNNELYKHRIIRKRISNPEINQPWLPQKGLRILLNDPF
ncbi:hypothetical protein G6F57_009426 [Rhizopus arrhizus]|uniref:Uncharacterized protein n=1 Tax=Rhizopus oryzae TaxID=64495 RepID=A0A9P6XII4_RHIOR|nr:hypothetical protein G6F23_009351 [Rhizopus arrhizus]KAG1411305.1 hypothetical protein G6F58_008623 [Rhizopus delemar]KAG0757996.1 hypothetical protein G6F24_010104 [Rhizopus arrhizus]KAG0786407.1 hypothetical protein G6F21_008616 [Rhizopus arrhizus]KAG0792158.1 hypothetical protein G6F22_005944 [Rhizopus arrhizus]